MKALQKGLLSCVVLLLASILLLFPPQTARADGDIDGDGVADGIEAIDGTDPNDIDSYIEHGGSRYCFDWNGFLGYLAQVLELRNSGCGEIGVRVDMHSIDGAVTDTSSITLAPAEQFDIFANSLKGFSENSYGLVCANIINGDLDSLVPRLAAYSLSEDASFRFAYTTPFVPFRTGAQYLSYNHIYPTLSTDDIGKLSLAFIQVSNDQATAQKGTLIFYDPDGTEVRRDRLTIPAKGRVDVNSHEIGVNTFGLVEWSPEEANTPFRVVLNRYYTAAVALELGFQSVVSIPAKFGSGALRAAPFSTVSRIAVIELNNTLSTPVHIPVAVYSHSGSLTSAQPGTVTIPAKGTRHVLLNDYLESGLGKAEIDPHTARSVIASLFEYQLSSANAFSSANVGDLKSGFGSFQTASYNNFLGGCRLRLANLDSSERTGSISMTRYDGTVVEIDSPISVPGNGVGEVDICSNDAESAYGEVRLTPSAMATLVGEIFRSNREESAELRVPLVERSICTAGITVSPASLAMTVNSAPGELTITNSSQAITITNVSAALPAGWTDVTQDASNCASVDAGESCTITLTPGASTHAAAEVGVQGDNTGRATALVSVVAEPTATLTVTGSPLELMTNGSSGNLIITNTSSTTTAKDIASDFSGTALDGNVTETANTCANLAPAASCTISYTAGSSVVAETTFSIGGSNTNTVTAAIEIVSGMTISSVSPNTGAAAGGVGVTLTGTGFTGATSVTFDGVPATSVNVVNATTITAVTPAHAAGSVDVVVDTPAGDATLVNGFTYAATAVGQAAFGGKIACLNGGLSNLIAKTTDEASTYAWGGFGIATGASSVTDGAANTAMIVSTLGNNGGTAYPAQLCSDYEVDSQGNSPCQAGNICYSDWFMPATTQFQCLASNGAAIGGFANSIFWVSTEFSGNPSQAADAVFYAINSVITGNNKNSSLYVRCVRAFTP